MTAASFRRHREDRIMTCIADTRRPDRHDSLAPLGQRWLALWQQARAARQARHYLSQPDEQALRDLGLQQGLIDPRDPKDAVALWLGRMPG
jgi:hypothetical protein